MSSEIELERFRGYLRFLAQLQLNPTLRQKEDISDVVQLTLVQAHQHLPAYRGSTEQELRAWLRSILNHTLVNVAKRYHAQKRDVRREVSIDQQLERSAARILGILPADATPPIQQMMQKERAEWLFEVMSELLPDERQAVVLKHVHGWKVAEIAEHLDRTPTAVAGLLRRALQKLRQRIQDSRSDL